MPRPAGRPAPSWPLGDGRGLFFKPLPLGNELPDLAVQFVNLPLLAFPLLPPFARERFRDGRQRLLLPSVDLGGVDTILRRQFVGGLLLPDGFHRDFGLELRRVPFAYICHVSPCLLLVPPILSRGLKYGEYHT